MTGVVSFWVECMVKIGLISDTHGYLDPEVLSYFSDRDEIWHAGDFGTLVIADELRKVAPLRGVYGNIDGQKLRQVFPLHERFELEGFTIWMTHIGGIPGRYCIPIRNEIEANPPDIFICGHSHILRIERDETLNRMLYINPGAAGRQGFQQYRTIVLFELDQKKIRNMKVVNLGEV